MAMEHFPFTQIEWHYVARWAGHVSTSFREYQLWQENYKWLIIAGVAILVLQSTLILLLFAQMRRRRKSDEAVKQLTARVMSASEEERRHIARELHDDIGQRLSLVMMQLDMFNHQLPPDPDFDVSDLHSSMYDLDALVTDVHNLSHSLHSSKLSHLGLRCALKELCDQVTRRQGVEIELMEGELPLAIPESVSLCFYRVAQEALNNAVRHSGSERVRMMLLEDDGRLKMQIRDFGIGFGADAQDKGLGFVAMQERLRIIGGKLLIKSNPGQGTEVTAEANVQ
jgi:signal transduction histidine kinase